MYQVTFLDAPTFNSLYLQRQPLLQLLLLLLFATEGVLFLAYAVQQLLIVCVR